jgi:hypothetical protein
MAAILELLERNGSDQSLGFAKEIATTELNDAIPAHEDPVVPVDRPADSHVVTSLPQHRPKQCW